MEVAAFGHLGTSGSRSGFFIFWCLYNVKTQGGSSMEVNVNVLVVTRDADRSSFSLQDPLEWQSNYRRLYGPGVLEMAAFIVLCNSKVTSHRRGHVPVLQCQVLFRDFKETFLREPFKFHWKSFEEVVHRRTPCEAENCEDPLKVKSACLEQNILLQLVPVVLASDTVRCSCRAWGVAVLKNSQLLWSGQWELCLTLVHTELITEVVPQLLAILTVEYSFCQFHRQLITLHDSRWTLWPVFNFEA